MTSPYELGYDKGKGDPNADEKDCPFCDETNKADWLEGLRDGKAAAGMETQVDRA